MVARPMPDDAKDYAIAPCRVKNPSGKVGMHASAPPHSPIPPWTAGPMNSPVHPELLLAIAIRQDIFYSPTMQIPSRSILSRVLGPVLGLAVLLARLLTR